MKNETVAPSGAAVEPPKSPHDDVLFTDFAPTVHDMYVAAALSGLIASLADKNLRELRGLNAAHQGVTPGVITIRDAFDYADECMAERKRRAERRA
ncbi:hypothetical protein [Paraburkholderia kururiensis]|uniref:hypothetical protein n=1 Tax=Paraburkholderia kururiensis TaxID=984307 RepID=UPI0005A67AC9|nr:hypothetical protein [Paraburkholderia kururiensis]